MFTRTPLKLTLFMQISVDLIVDLVWKSQKMQL
jgi:hypothetical protein